MKKNLEAVVEIIRTDDFRVDVIIKRQGKVPLEKTLCVGDKIKINSLREE
jgi:hypothetical protein